MKATLSTILILLTTAITWGQDFEFQIRTRTQEECQPFEHCWQGGEQSYELSERSISSLLLTFEDIRKLANETTGTTTLEKVEPAGAAESDPQIQLVSFEEGDSENDVESSEDQDAENKSVDSDVAITGNGNIYSDLDIKQLRKEISSQKEAIEANTQLTDAVRSSRLQILTSANEALLRLNEHNGQKIKYDNFVKNVEEEVDIVKSRLAEDQEAAIPDITDSTMSEQLVTELKERQDSLQKSKTALSEIEKQITRLSERVDKIPGERSAAQQSLEEIQDEITERSAQADDPDNQLALLLLEIRRQVTNAELAKLDSEETRQEQGAELDTLNRDYYSREVKRLQAEVTNWERVVKRLRKNEVREDQITARKEAEKAHVFLSPLATRNEELVLERKQVFEAVEKLKSDFEKITSEADAIVERRTEIADKIEAAGLTGTNGMELVDLRRNLSTTGESHIQIRDLQAELRKVNLKKVGLKEERAELSDLSTAVQNRIQIGENHVLFENAIEFMESKRGYLDELIKDYQSYGRKISEVSEARKKLIDEINETIVYIDENAIWIRSAEPVQIADLTNVKHDLETFFDSENWAHVIATSQQRATQRLYETSIAALAIVTLVAINRRVKRKLIPTHDRHEPSA